MLCRYERTIFKSDKGFCIFAYSTSDESVPKEARNRSYYHDDKIHFTAIGYHLIATDAVEVELDGTWENSKHGLQLSVSMCKEVVPRDQAGILAYLSSGIIKGIGPETAKAIVARFGDKTMEVLEKEPDKLLILLDRIKSGAQLIIVGDADQLPSVGAGNVLREMIRSEKVPTAVLETVFRQASNSRIITNAYAINHNDTHLQFGDDFQFLEVQNSEEAAQLVIKNYLREVSLHGIEDVQILSPLRKRGAVAANALNETIRDLVNPPNNLKKEVKCGSRVFRVGDRIMQTANRINVSNGDVGVITDMKKEDDETITCVRLLDGRTLQYTQEMLEDLEFSYCTTIHKSQGQEYPVIIVPLLKEHYIMLRRNLLYGSLFDYADHAGRKGETQQGTDQVPCGTSTKDSAEVALFHGTKVGAYRCSS